MRGISVNKVVLLGAVLTAFACQVLAYPHPTDAIPDYDERREYEDDSGGGGYGSSSSFFDRSSPSISIDEYPRKSDPGFSSYCIEVAGKRFLMREKSNSVELARRNLLNTPISFLLANQASDERWSANCKHSISFIERKIPAKTRDFWSAVFDLMGALVGVFVVVIIFLNGVSNLREKIAKNQQK